MNLTHILSLACLVAAIGLAVAGQSGLAGVVFAAGTVIELVVAAITGKQGNDTGR